MFMYLKQKKNMILEPSDCICYLYVERGCVFHRVQVLTRWRMKKMERIRTIVSLLLKKGSKLDIAIWIKCLIYIRYISVYKDELVKRFVDVLHRSWSSLVLTLFKIRTIFYITYKNTFTQVALLEFTISLFL